MREILFRGKRIDDGQWIYGYFAILGGKPCIVWQVADDYSFWDEVDPETVGQYTGMTDRNSKKIFEGDIVSFYRHNALGYVTDRVGRVLYYDELPIFYIMATTGDAWDWCECQGIEVIGNIHDNPELLEVHDETN